LPIASILLLVLTGANAGDPAPLLSHAISRSLNDFVSCFTRTPEDPGRPAAVVPTSSGSRLLVQALERCK
jgi:hypothetical protein